MTDRLTSSLLFVSIFLFGLLIGLVLNPGFLFEIDTKVSAGDLANLVLSVAVAFLIPISLSPMMSDKRVSKDILIAEVNECIKFLAKIKEEVDEYAQENASSSEMRMKVNSMISRTLSMKLGSLRTQLEYSFQVKSEEIRKEIEKRGQEYWNETTGGELMSENFKFDLRFSMIHDKEFTKLENCLKRAVLEINAY